MPYIIDGNNLIGTSPDFNLKDPDSRQKMIEVLFQFHRSKKNSIIVVFDGEPAAGIQRQTMSNKFQVIYPTYGATADDEIKRLLNGYKDCQGVILVTSDRNLKTFAKEKGARSLNSIEFYYELKRINHVVGKKEEVQKRIDQELSNTEVDQWLKIFKKE